MPGKVIVRHGHEVNADGIVLHKDEPLPWTDADAIAGRRLDRRKNWAFINGELCSMVRWTTGCSGCIDDNPSSSRGHGCEECGYHGVVRRGQWVPDVPIDIE